MKVILPVIFFSASMVLGSCKHRSNNDNGAATQSSGNGEPTYQCSANVQKGNKEFDRLNFQFLKRYLGGLPGRDYKKVYNESFKLPKGEHLAEVVGHEHFVDLGARYKESKIFIRRSQDYNELALLNINEPSFKGFEMKYVNGDEVFTVKCDLDLTVGTLDTWNQGRAVSIVSADSKVMMRDLNFPATGKIQKSFDLFDIEVSRLPNGLIGVALSYPKHRVSYEIDACSESTTFILPIDSSQYGGKFIVTCK